MVKTVPGWAVAAAVAGALLVGGLFLWARQEAPPAEVRVGDTGRGGGARGDVEVPRIGLDRLQQPRPESGLGRRDLFDFATPPPPPSTPPPPPTPEIEAPPVTAPTPPPLPALNIKYIGTLERPGRPGLKLAMFMTDRKEVLTGQVGQVVANRFVVKRIGLESVDIQELGSESVRRIPLRGN